MINIYSFSGGLSGIGKGIDTRLQITDTKKATIKSPFILKR